MLKHIRHHHVGFVLVLTLIIGAGIYRQDNGVVSIIPYTPFSILLSLTSWGAALMFVAGIFHAPNLISLSVYVGVLVGVAAGVWLAGWQEIFMFGIALLVVYTTWSSTSQYITVIDVVSRER